MTDIQPTADAVDILARTIWGEAAAKAKLA